MPSDAHVRGGVCDGNVNHFTFQHALITTGPYAHLRHPAYTGIYILYVGLFGVLSAPNTLLQALEMKYSMVRWLTWYQLAYPWIVLPFFVLRAKREDAMLKARFGKSWEAWAERTPYLLIPGLY